MAANTWPQLTFVWDPTFGERPGAEFFRSRLRRAQRVPPEEASSDVRAFVESAALLEGICTDVPCNFGPEITCPHESTQLSAGAAPEAMAVALYRHALANYITDGQPEHYLPFTECLAITGLVYFRWGAAPLQVVAAVSARGRRRRRHRGVPAEARGVAAQVLHLWGAGCVLHADGTLEGRDRMAQHFAAACRLLDRPAAQRECGDQLAALAAAHGLPAFSLPQLRYLLHYFAARRGIEALANLNQQLVAAQLEAGMPSRAAATTAAVEARLRMPLWRRLARETQAEAMAAWQLAPDRPAALNCVHGASVQGIGLPDEMRAVISAQTIELARTQRSDRWLCQACHDRFGTVVFSASAMLEPTERPLLQAKARQAEELHAEAAEALARSKRLLPQPWVTEMENHVEQERVLLAALRRLVDEPGSPTRAVEDLFEGAASTSARERPRCSGCGADAVGLRACSACRVALYCGEDCQRKAWRAHKAECARLVQRQREEAAGAGE